MQIYKITRNMVTLQKESKWKTYLTIIYFQIFT